MWSLGLPNEVSNQLSGRRPLFSRSTVHWSSVQTRPTEINIMPRKAGIGLQSISSSRSYIPKEQRPMDRQGLGPRTNLEVQIRIPNKSSSGTKRLVYVVGKLV
jgi:hypothetical protein